MKAQCNIAQLWEPDLQITQQMDFLPRGLESLI